MRDRFKTIYRILRKTQYPAAYTRDYKVWQAAHVAGWKPTNYAIDFLDALTMPKDGGRLA